MLRKPPPRPVIRDDEILSYLRKFKMDKGRLPTAKETACDLRIWRGALSRNLERLKERGVIRRLPVGTLLVELIE